MTLVQAQIYVQKTSLQQLKKRSECAEVGTSSMKRNVNIAKAG